MPDINQRTPVLPGLLGRITQGVRYAITGISPAGWFEPGQPLLPVAPDYVAGRAFDYPVGYNLAIQPRAWEGTGFEEILMMADAYDVARLLIETRKDQMSRLSWTIRKRDENQGRVAGKRSSISQDATAQKIQAFLEYPNKRDDWSSWLRQALEQVLVPDALTIYPLRTKGGDLYSLELLDGTTIAPRLGPDGRRPNPPDVAYQQVIKGLPAVDYTSDQLIYMPRNRRVHKVYGFSPIEQTMVTINIALRRQASQLYYFTQGNTPEALVSCPPEWSVDQIKEFQRYWDTLFEGNLGARRMTKFVPGLQKYEATKEPPLKDEFDDYINRVLCFAFSISPQALVKQMNRASAQQQQEQANEEGLFPYMQYIKSVMDMTVRHHAGFPGYEFVWETDTYASPAQRVQILSKYVLSGIMTPNEARNDLGLPEVEDGDVLFLPSTMANIDDVAAGTAGGGMGGGGQAFGTLNGRSKGRQNPTSPKTTSDATPREKTDQVVGKVYGSTDELPAAIKSDLRDSTKRRQWMHVFNSEISEHGDESRAFASAWAAVHKSYEEEWGVAKIGAIPFDLPNHHDVVSLDRPIVQHATSELAGYLRGEFAHIGAELRARASSAFDSVNKADEDATSTDDQKLPHEREIVDRVIQHLGLLGLLSLLSPTVRLSLMLIAEEAARASLERIGASDDEIARAAASAEQYADDRSAELLGSSRNLAGDLVADEHAERSILDSTRRMIERAIRPEIEGNSPGDLIAGLLPDLFSPERADNIAQFEIDSASNAGVLAALRVAAESRPELRKSWFALINCCDECAANAAVGPIPVGAAFPSGDQAPQAHLHCRCELIWI